jgi:hypothetical protein
MTFQPGAGLYSQGFGTKYENVEVPHIDTRAPSATDVLYPVGKRWIFTNTSEWTLLGFTSAAGALSATWVQVTDADGPVLSVTGTANQITATNTAGNVVLSTPAAFIAPGSIAATTTLTATLGNITATNGNIVRGTAGNKDIYSSVATTTAAGANSAGTVTLASGTATVATTAVTAASQIRLYRQGIGATGAAALGIVTLGTVTAGTSFVINAVQAANATANQTTDVSVIGWEIVN